MKLQKIIAIDFDGCICTNCWPDIGIPNWDIINEALEEQKNGACLILWTCRSGKELESAIAACRNWGIIFDFINENSNDRVDAWGANPRKIFADEYWDDLAIVKIASIYKQRRKANDAKSN